MKTLATRNLSKSFGSLAATRDVSLEFAAGRRHAVIGPNGAGKTTLFNLLTGELSPDSGEVLFDGRDITALSPDARVRLGMGRSFQRNSLFPDYTVRESLAVAVAVSDGLGRVCWRPFSRFGAVAGRAEQIAAQVGMTDELDTITRHLSYGSQRQLEIGLALASDPEVLLLDEPSSGMSPEETAGMQDLIANLPAGLTVIIIEHDMDVVFGLADSVTVLDYGSVLDVGPPDRIRASAAVQDRYLGTAP